MIIFTDTRHTIKSGRWVFIALLTFLIALHSAHSQAAGIQKWVDENGKIHYGDRPPEGKNSEVVQESLTIVQGATSNSAPKAVLYSTSWCGYCKKARAFMQQNNIPFTEYDIEKDRFANARYKKLGGRGVPFLVLGDDVMRGFNTRSYRAFFEL